MSYKNYLNLLEQIQIKFRNIGIESIFSFFTEITAMLRFPLPENLPNLFCKTNPSSIKKEKANQEKG